MSTVSYVHNLTERKEGDGINETNFNRNTWENGIRDSIYCRTDRRTGSGD